MESRSLPPSKGNVEDVSSHGIFATGGASGKGVSYPGRQFSSPRLKAQAQTSRMPNGVALPGGPLPQGRPPLPGAGLSDLRLSSQIGSPAGSPRHQRSLTNPEMALALATSTVNGVLNPMPRPIAESKGAFAGSSGAQGIAANASFRRPAKAKPKRTFFVRDLEDSDAGATSTGEDTPAANSSVKGPFTGKDAPSEEKAADGSLADLSGAGAVISVTTTDTAPSSPSKTTGTPESGSPRSSRSPGRKKIRKARARKEVKVGRFTITEFEPASPSSPQVGEGGSPVGGRDGRSHSEAPRPSASLLPEYLETPDGRRADIADGDRFYPSRTQGILPKGSSTGSRWVSAHSAAKTARQHLQPRDSTTSAQSSPNRDEQQSRSGSMSSLVSTQSSLMGPHHRPTQLPEKMSRSNSMLHPNMDLLRSVSSVYSSNFDAKAMEELVGRMQFMQSQFRQAQQRVDEVVRDQDQLQEILLQILSHLHSAPADTAEQETSARQSEDIAEALDTMGQLKQQLDAFLAENRFLKDQIRQSQQTVAKRDTEIAAQSQELAALQEVNKELRARMARQERKYNEEKDLVQSLQKRLDTLDITAKESGSVD